MGPMLPPYCHMRYQWGYSTIGLVASLFYAAYAFSSPLLDRIPSRISKIDAMLAFFGALGVGIALLMPRCPGHCRINYYHIWTAFLK